MHYNSVRQHKALKILPATAAGVADNLWTIGDIVDLVETAEAQKAA